MRAEVAGRATDATVSISGAGEFRGARLLTQHASVTVAGAGKVTVNAEKTLKATISGAGADVAWSLWVTKFAPPERVADYMSVHTFFTGVRGFLAPVTASKMACILSRSLKA